ncbi:hypothetical protein O181_052030 [Austropuccinia psidii MF-1]|uniref:Uncharacterized protein n=1 Tax=Austropuccinia psidii MF-1 TaxID=1389203 RepID=A0A9Q3E449_9BASI|nr:hypothetical protein [Austropuccinia psidii MF-1]
MRSRRSRSFSGLLGGYPGISEGARARLGEFEDEEGEESVEEEDSGETEVSDALANASDMPQGLIWPFLVNLLSLRLIQVSSRWWSR